MVKNQSAQNLNRCVTSNFWWLRSANNVKFTEESVMCMEKNVLVQKIITNGLNIGFSLQA